MIDMTGRCQVCKLNKEVTSIFCSPAGFLITFTCGHQIAYKCESVYDDHVDEKWKT